MRPLSRRFEPTIVDFFATRPDREIDTLVVIDATGPGAQRFIDSLVQASVRVRKDSAFTVKVLKKWEKSDDTAAMQATASYYMKEIVPALPYPKPVMFKDALAVLVTRNEAAKGYNVSKLLNQSYVKSADNRGLGK